MPIPEEGSFEDRFWLAAGWLFLAASWGLIALGLVTYLRDPAWTWNAIADLFQWAPGLWIFIAVAGLYSLYLKLTGQKPPRGDAP